MKTRCQFLKLLVLLSLFLFFSPIADAQATRNPEMDLDVGWNSTHVLLYGTIENKSANAYGCVRIEFSLYTRADMLAPGETRRRLGVLPVVVRDIPPRTKRSYQQSLPYPAEVMRKANTECSAAAEDQKVTVYEHSNFAGRSRTFGVGKHRLFNAADFNDLTSSIKVAPGLVVIVYEHADAGTYAFIVMAPRRSFRQEYWAGNIQSQTCRRERTRLGVRETTTRVALRHREDLPAWIFSQMVARW